MGSKILVSACLPGGDARNNGSKKASLQHVLARWRHVHKHKQVMEKKPEMIQCKRVYDAPSGQDGYRVLVDRLWPRGVKKTDLNYDEWCKDLAPSSELRKAFHADVLDFAAFREAYLAELADKRETGLPLKAKSKSGVLTLLYAAKDTRQNHALVLAQWLESLSISK